MGPARLRPVAARVDPLCTGVLARAVWDYASDCGVSSGSSSLSFCGGGGSPPKGEPFPAFALAVLYCGRCPYSDDPGIPFGMDVAAGVRGLRGHFRDGDAQVGRLTDWLSSVTAGAFSVVRGHVFPTAWRRGLVTSVSWDLPDAVRSALRYDAEHRASSSTLVNVVTGDPVSKEEALGLAQAAAEEDARLERDATVEAASFVGGVPAITTDLLDYLGDLDAPWFERRVREADVAEVGPQNPMFRDRVAFLEAKEDEWGLRAVPRPVYKPVLRTQRVVPASRGLPTVEKTVRQAVLSRCVEIDWSSAHFSLAASRWDVPAARAWLDDLRERGVSMWADLASDHLRAAFPGADFDPDPTVPAPAVDPDSTDLQERRGWNDAAVLKAASKRFVNPMLYGQSEENLMRLGNPEGMGGKERWYWTALCDWITNRFGLEDVAPFVEALLDHAALGATFAAREAQLDEIADRGHLVDVFGRRYTVGEVMDGRPVTHRTCLAADISADEHYVMAGHVARVAMDHARERREAGKRVEVWIVLWQYDGFTYRVWQKKQAQKWADRFRLGLRRGLDALASEHGCPPIAGALRVDDYSGLGVS